MTITLSSASGAFTGAGSEGGAREIGTAAALSGSDLPTICLPARASGSREDR